MPPPLLQQSPPPLPKARQRHTLFGVPLDFLNRTELLELFSDWLTGDQPRFVITANTLFLLDAEKNPALKRIGQKASLVIPESSGISWAAGRHKKSLPPRVAGIDAAFQLCGLAEIKGTPVYLLGGSKGVAERAADFLYKQFPYLWIAGMRDGYFRERDEEAIINDISRSRAKVVLVAMGMPKQELWIEKNLHRLPPGVYMGVGGSFDVWAGDLKRAPLWMQESGLEWLYRLIQEPWRASRILQLPRFAFKVVLGRAH